jgi:glycosyltransferase involved in cell wall biosynthesis
MNGSISLSIRLMVYNNEEYIGECLDGISIQKTNFPIEVIVGDDFSNDKTLDIIKNYLLIS